MSSQQNLMPDLPIPIQKRVTCIMVTNIHKQFIDTNKTFLQLWYYRSLSTSISNPYNQTPRVVTPGEWEGTNIPSDVANLFPLVNIKTLKAVKWFQKALNTLYKIGNTSGVYWRVYNFKQSSVLIRSKTNCNQQSTYEGGTSVTFDTCISLRLQGDLL